MIPVIHVREEDHIVRALCGTDRPYSSVSIRGRHHATCPECKDIASGVVHEIEDPYFDNEDAAEDKTV